MKKHPSEALQFNQKTSLSEIEAVVQELLTQKVQYPKMSGAEIHVELTQGFAVNVRMGKLESLEHSIEQSATIKVYVDHRASVTTVSELTPQALLAALDKAYQIAHLTNQDPCMSLPDKDLLAFDYPELDLYHPWNLTVPEAIKLATEAEARGLSYDAHITNSEGADLSSYQNHFLYANSLGFTGKYSRTIHRFSCALLASQNREMQQDDEYTVACLASGLSDFKKVAEKAAQRAIARLNPTSLPSGKLPVLFSPQMARGLLKSFMGAIQGANLYRKSSFLLDHLGKRVFPDFMDINQKPHLLKGIGSAPFDSDGVRTRDCFFIRNGILENYLLGDYSAKRLNMQTNGNAGGPFNVFVSASEQRPAEDFKALLKQMGKGLFVTDLMGQGINLINGNYSRGATGFWVENGEIQYPVSGITIAGHLQDMFLNVVGIGNDVDIRGNIKTGSILLEEMTIAGNT